MKESLRRVILFTVIVITGSVMILFDVPLILMIPLILAVGLVILLVLGAITVADIRSVFTRKKTKNPKKISLIQRLDNMKFFEKKPVQPDKKPASPQKKENLPKSPAQSAGSKTGAGTHLRSFFTSLGSLRTVLKERSRQAKKVEHIDALLDKAVSEKVKSSALASAGKGAGTKIPPPGSGGGSGVKEQDQDPFLSLSGDEFDASLLDGLDDQETPGSAASGQVPATGALQPAPAVTVSEPVIPMPSLDISSQAGDILKDNEAGLEEFKDLEGGESIEKDFSELDNVNLDDIELDVDMEDETLPAPGSPPSPAESPAATVKADWVASDAPKGADLPEDETSGQDDMSSFAGGASGSDSDLLSSLASDVKHVTKEKNTSLLRDLKEFKAPATDIENELNDIHEMMKAVPNPRKKVIQSPRTMK